MGPVKNPRSRFAGVKSERRKKIKVFREKRDELLFHEVGRENKDGVDRHGEARRDEEGNFFPFFPLFFFFLAADKEFPNEYSTGLGGRIS